MALRLDDAETAVRALTRHTGDTTRLTQVQARIYLHFVYRELRTWLRQLTVAPQLYLLRSSDQVVAAGGTVTLATVSASLESPFRVERKITDGSYRPMLSADEGDPNNHQAGGYTWREEGGLLRFGPDDFFEGTVRVLYHDTPATISTDAATFAVPVELEVPLQLKTCGYVALQDSEGAEAKASWDSTAQALMDAAVPGLRKRRGVHQQAAGLRAVMGY